MNIRGSGHLYGTITATDGKITQYIYNRKREESKSFCPDGTITATDRKSTQYIYNRKREESKSFRPGDTALLTGPANSISACGSFNIDVHLMDRDDYLSQGDVLSRDRIAWNYYQATNVYDDPLYDEVEGEYCFMRVNYIVLFDAVQATVKVTLIIGDRKVIANVFGLITACNCNFSNESVLFQKASNEHIDVRPWQLIPLSRSVVAVPLKSVVIVRADLWEYDAISSDVIAKGTYIRREAYLWPAMGSK